MQCYATQRRLKRVRLDEPRTCVASSQANRYSRILAINRKQGAGLAGLDVIPRHVPRPTSSNPHSISGIFFFGNVQERETSLQA